MVPRWNTFYGKRSAQDQFCVTCRNGPFVATGAFKPTMEEAISDASAAFEREFAFLTTNDTDLSSLLTDD